MSAEKETKLISDAGNNILERLGWSIAKRDQAGVAKDLAEGKDISEIYGLGEAGLFDEFFYFLSHFKITALLTKLAPKPAQRKNNIDFSAVILIYVMRVTAGLRFFWHMPVVLLQSQALMRLVGFNGEQIQEGSCKRGLKKRSNTPDELRGPLCADYIANQIEKITARALQSCFNGVIKILAANSFFPKRIHALLDASEIESTEKCIGCGKVTKEKPPTLRQRKGRLRKLTETVFGFKIWLVWDNNSKLPLSICFSTIEVHDSQMAQKVIEQAIDNLAGFSKIVTLAFDRGFLDGKFMWWLDKNKIIFYTPSKSNLEVYTDAISMALSSPYRQIREVKRNRGSGKNRRTTIEHYEVVGVEGLLTAGFYGQLGSGSHQNRSDYIANPINAVVVQDGPYYERHPETSTFVILTNGPVNKPFEPYDRYDARSEIENSVFREAKQSWFIERPSKNTADGFRAHAYLTILVMALTTAFRLWSDSQNKLESKGKETGIRKYRQYIQQQNANKFIIFDNNRYAIFEAYEFAILCGMKVLKPRGVEETITKDDILKKYGVQLE